MVGVCRLAQNSRVCNHLGSLQRMENLQDPVCRFTEQQFPQQDTTSLLPDRSLFLVVSSGQRGPPELPAVIGRSRGSHPAGRPGPHRCGQSHGRYRGGLSSQRGRWLLCCHLAGVGTNTSWHQSFLFFHGTSLLHVDVNGGVWVICPSNQCFYIICWSMLSDVVAGTVRLPPTILKEPYLWTKKVIAQHKSSSPLFTIFVEQLSVPRRMQLRGNRSC